MLTNMSPDVFIIKFLYISFRDTFQELHNVLYQKFIYLFLFLFYYTLLKE